MTKLSITRYALAFALVALVAAMPSSAEAVEAFQNGICYIQKALNGSVGRALATIAIIFLGIGAFFGKVNWGLAIVVTCGIVAIFGASALAGAIGTASSGNNAAACA